MKKTVELNEETIIRVAKALIGVIGSPWTYEKMPEDVKALWKIYATAAISAVFEE